MSLIDDAMSDMSDAVNSVLGHSCLYQHQSGAVTDDVMIILDRNKSVHDNNGFIAGYRCEAVILKSQIPEITDDSFTNPKGEEWSVNQITKETSSKWYVDVTLIGA